MSRDSDTLNPGQAAQQQLATMWPSALFWSVFALSVFPWMITQVAAVHELISPGSAEALWGAWWYLDDPFAEFAWGSVMLACAVGMWHWLNRRGVLAEVVARGDLNKFIFVLIALAIAVDWYGSDLIDWIAALLTQQDEVPVQKPEYEYVVTAANLPGELFSSVIAAPLFEEFAFRGFLLGVLLARGWPVGRSIVLVAALFAATHQQYYLSGQISVFVLGALMGFLRIASGGLAAPVIAHGLYNLIVVFYNYSLDLSADLSSS